jgi:hypothetical protein
MVEPSPARSNRQRGRLAVPSLQTSIGMKRKLPIGVRREAVYSINALPRLMAAKIGPGLLLFCDSLVCFEVLDC